MRDVVVVRLKRAGVGAVAFVVSFFAMMCVGVAFASACAYEANPGPSPNVLRVFSAPSHSATVVGSMAEGREFYGSCTESDGWITVSAQWTLTWSDTPPFYYVDGAYAIAL